MDGTTERTPILEQPMDSATIDLRTSDGETVTAARDVASRCATIRYSVEDTEGDAPLPLPLVDAKCLRWVLSLLGDGATLEHVRRDTLE